MGLKVSPDKLETIKLALNNRGFNSQRAFAENIEITRGTVSKFFNGREIGRTNFEEICNFLGLNWQEIIAIDTSDRINESLYNEPVEGEIPLNSPFYIKRNSEEDKCYEELRSPYCLIRINSPRKTGKTSLLRRIIQDAGKSNYKIILIDFESESNRNALHDLDQFLQWFFQLIVLKIENSNIENPQDFWNQHKEVGSKVICKLYLENEILLTLDSPLLLIFDRIDYLYNFPEIALEFFPMLRHWHEESKNSETFQKLKLVIAYSTRCYLNFSINQSPFNVGQCINLSEFNKEQIISLAQQYGFTETLQEQILILTNLVGKHPYLVKLALDYVKRHQTTLSEALEDENKMEIYGNHLESLWQKNKEDEDLKNLDYLREIFAKIINSQKNVEFEKTVGYKLEGMGLITIKNEQIVDFSCDLYKNHFKGKLFPNL